MKNAKFYIAIVGLLLIGVGSLFLYRQQLEGRSLEFEGYEINAIEKRVDELYNKDKTDIKVDIKGELTALKPVFDELKEKELSLVSMNRIDKMEEDFLTAKNMDNAQDEVLKLFEEVGVIDLNTTPDKITTAKINLEVYESKDIYYDRNNQLLNEAENQLIANDEAENFVNSFFEEGEVIEEVSSEELEKLKGLIAKIKNNTLKEQLALKFDEVTTVLAEREELEAEEEIEVEPDDVEVADEDSVAPDSDNTQNTEQANNTSNTARNNHTGSNYSQNTGGNTQPSASSQNDSSAEVESPPSIISRSRNTEVKEIPYSTTTVESSSLDKGTQLTYTEGKNGKRIITYETVTYSDGTSNRRVVSEETTDPTNAVVTVGTRETTQPSNEDESEENLDE